MFVLNGATSTVRGVYLPQRGGVRAATTCPNEEDINLRKFLIGLAVLAVAAVPAAVAFAQNPAAVVGGSASITPSKSGTSKKPKAATFKFTVTNSPESKTTVRQIVTELPKGVKLDGTKLDKCTTQDIISKGEDKCPKGSKLGTGVSYAFLVGPGAPPDCVGSHGAASGCLTFNTTFYVGGPKSLTVTLVSGGNAFAPLSGKITNSGRKLTIDIPQTLQQTPAGYSALSQLGGTFKASKTVKGKKYSFVSTTSCPSSKKWTVKTTLNYAPNPAPPTASSGSNKIDIKCSK
jgi:hypothetical protein